MQARFSLSEAEILEAPLDRTIHRLLREEARKRNEEHEKRHNQWIAFVTAFYAGRAESEPPQTKEEYDRQNAKKPKKPGPLHWQRSQRARRFWEEIFKGYQEAAFDPYRWEEIMRYPDHLFPEPPPEPEPKTDQEVIDDGLEAAQRALLKLFGEESGEEVPEEENEASGSDVP